MIVAGAPKIAGVFCGLSVGALKVVGEQKSRAQDSTKRVKDGLISGFCGPQAISVFNERGV